MTDLERYRLAADSINGVATVALLCATCNERDENTGPVKVFDFLFPSIADVQEAADAHELASHREQREEGAVEERPTVIHVTAEELRTRRAQLIRESGMSETELREAAETWSLPERQALIWETVKGFDYLLDGANEEEPGVPTATRPSPGLTTPSGTPASRDPANGPQPGA